MSDIAAFIQGSEALTGVYGGWPSFHDAEVLEFNLWRGDVKQHVFPELTVKLHVWELTNETDERGHLIRRHHMLVKLRFHGVEAFNMEGFNHQNAVFELLIEQRERSNGPSPYFSVKFTSAFGMGALFECSHIEVLNAVRCTELGETHT